MRIYLIGYMGCGKSSVGRKLARNLGFEFIDTDSIVEQEEGAEIADIIRYEGEEYFREVERRVLEGTAQNDNVVISTGGGMPIWRDNMKRIGELGTSIYIRRTPQQIFSRLSPYGRYKRPKFRGLTDEELMAFMKRNMAEREPVYTCADHIIDCDDKSDDDVLTRILNIVKQEEQNQ